MNMNEITLKNVEKSDMQMLFEWRNAEENRRFCLDSRVIPWEDHIKWFQQILIDENMFLLIATQDNNPVGVLRYDIDETNAEVSIYLKPGLAGKGLGAAILQKGEIWIKDNLKYIKSITAEILQENIASIRIFQKCGFSVHYLHYNKLL